MSSFLSKDELSFKPKCASPQPLFQWYLVYFSLFAYAYRLCITLHPINPMGQSALQVWRAGVKRNGILIIYALITYLLLPLLVNSVGAILGTSFLSVILVFW